MDIPSTKPYLLRAIHEWCSDNGMTPYITVAVDAGVRVPPEFVRDRQITLNIGYDATGHLRIDNETLSFSARFNGVAREILIPIGNVLAIYAKENGMGMGFEPEKPPAPSPNDTEPGRPQLRRVK
ncbi:MAG: ClpXP protease specificity-enhancing factor [Candidatus Accumulibacter sp.]|nr:ClpXP protease specificity-enhancing factor [Accumulibacter sp.]